MSNTIITYLTELSEACNELQQLLKRDNLEIHQGSLCPDGLTDCLKQQPSLVLLECQGQGVGELTLCQEIRKIYSGLLVVLVDGDNTQFSILALGLGVDASFTVSQGLPLVAANIKALLRRFNGISRQPLLTFDKLVINAQRREVTVEEQKVNLSSVEFRVIWLLAKNSGTVVTRDEIYRELYNESYNGYDRNIDLYVSRIRNKIGDDPSDPVYLKTVRGVGYQFVSPRRYNLLHRGDNINIKRGL